ncbi:MAG: nucleotidyltransferase domain-containing protein [Planctomycetota bacterium]
MSHLVPRVTSKLLAGIRDRIVESFRPHRIVLFGSHAYGKPHPWSDVDLLVVMPSRERMARRIMRVARTAHVPFLPMDVLLFTPEEIRSRLVTGDPFIRNVLSRGKVLYQRGKGR